MHLLLLLADKNSLSVLSFDLEQIYEKESSENEPLLVVTGTGADPTQVSLNIDSIKSFRRQFSTVLFSFLSNTFRFLWI